MYDPESNLTDWASLYKEENFFSFLGNKTPFSIHDIYLQSLHTNVIVTYNKIQHYVMSPQPPKEHSAQ